MVTRVIATSGRVVNPVTTAATVIASGPGSDAPLLASTHPEWIADFILSAPVFPLPLCNLLSLLLPAAAQAYYESWVDTIDTAPLRAAKEIFPKLSLPVLALALDLALGVSFVAFLSFWVNPISILTFVAIVFIATRRGHIAK